MKWAKLCVVNMLVSGLAIYACLILFHGKQHVVYRGDLKKITNSSYPNEIEAHFGKPLQAFNPTQIGLPTDGYCKDYSNQVSWRVIVCMGTQPETQP